VTPMADGRVLKGSRPQQRKQAEFWTEVMDNTEELVQQVQAPETTPEPAVSEVESVQPKKNERKKRATTSEQPRKRAASAVTRKKNAGPTKPHAAGPRPSQRGFKWPTA
jgi:membrane peptidoglycan carboxypeptidase